MLAKPRILHIYKDYYPPVMGGVELTINLLAEGCQDRFETTVLVNSGNRSNSQETINNVKVIKVSEWGRAASAPISPAFFSALRREARHADILHFHHPNPTGDLARFLTRPHPPAVMTYHSDVVRQKWAMLAYGPLQNWMMKHCAVIMPTSPNYMKSSPWLQRHVDRCTVVPLGIRLEQFLHPSSATSLVSRIRREHQRSVILFVGRLRYYKGLQYLVSAMPRINADLVIAGTGPMAANLQQLAAQLNVLGKVHFPGDISHEEKIAAYQAADVFCMPSHLRSEAFGLSQVEAMASGLPVVSTRVASGVPFVNLDGVSGLSVTPENPDALAEGINKLLTDKPLRKRLAAGARQRAIEEFSAERMCERVMAVYDSVLAGKIAPK